MGRGGGGVISYQKGDELSGSRLENRNFYVDQIRTLRGGGGAVMIKYHTPKSSRAEC